MLRNYITIALRNLKKHKAYTVIHVAGLSLGIGSALLLLLYIADELSYDRYHQHADRIYRVAMDVKMGGETRKVAVAPPALAPALQQRFTAIQQYALIRPLPDFTITHEETTFTQAGVYMGSPAVSEVFTYRFLRGDAATALQQPHAIVITQTLARRLFGSTEVLGKSVVHNGQPYEVTGLIADMPENGHFTPTALLSMPEPDKLSDWGDWNWYNYVLAAPGFSPVSFQQQLEKVYQQHLQDRVAEAGGEHIQFVMQPLTDIHFSSRRDFEMHVNDGNKGYLYLLGTIACLLLLIAAINYINLMTARSAGRAREVGVRKALGSTRSQLIVQFLTESFVLSGMAFGLSLLSVWLLLPAFNRFTEKAVDLSVLLSPVYLLTAAGVLLATGLLSGLYTAFFLSGFQPAAVLKGSLEAGRKGISLRKALVVLQFCVSMVMVVCTLVVFRQLLFLQQQDLGFDHTQLIHIDLDKESRRHFMPLKNELLRHPRISSVSSSSEIPGQKPGVNSFAVDSPAGTQHHIFQQLWVDHAFLPAMDISLLAGRNFTPGDPEDTTRAGVLVNESLVRRMGWQPEEALGKQLSSGEWKDQIIGVVRDFHMVSLHEQVEPLVIRYHIPSGQSLIRISSQEVGSTLAYIQQTWERVAGNTVLEYIFLDQHFRQQYAQDEKRGVLLAIFSGMTIFIACMGLFGLSAYTARQRTKEIGVRKVMGASSASILLLLSADYMKLLLIALLIAIPVANYLATEWLHNFAYQTAVAWWYFALPALGVMLLALLTIGQRSLKAARHHPADSLRYE